MKHPALLSLVIALAAAFCIPHGGWAEEVRTWTDKQGRKIEAALESIDENRKEVILVLKDSGMRAPLPLERLSNEDQAYIQKKLGEIKEKAGRRKWVGIPEWKERHLKVLALIEDIKKKVPAGQSSRAELLDRLVPVTEGGSSLTLIGKTGSLNETLSESSMAMNSDSVFNSGILMSAAGTMDLKPRLQSHFNQPRFRINIERSHFQGSDLVFLCMNTDDGSYHMFRYSGDLEHLCNITQALHDLEIRHFRSHDRVRFHMSASGDVVVFSQGDNSRLVRIGPRGSEILAYGDGSKLYTEQGTLVGEGTFPSLHADGTVSTVTEHLDPRDKESGADGIAFLKEGQVDRISSQEIATSVLGGDAEVRTVTTPSGREVNLSWRMRVHDKVLGLDGRLHLLLEAEFQRANPAGIVTDHKSWHVAAVDGHRVVPLFHSQDPRMPKWSEFRIQYIHPQQDGSVYMQIYTGKDMLCRIVNGGFKTLWIAGTQYMDGKKYYPVRNASNLPAWNDRFLMADPSSDKTPLICHDPDLTPLLSAAGAGEAKAMVSLAGRLLKGDGIAKDTDRAIRLYEKAAEAGDADAMSELGLCLADGDGVAKDMDKAVDWFRKSAGQGHALAMFNLGVCYSTGEGVAKDEGEAFDWFIRSAQQGAPVALYEMGVVYDTGIAGGMPKDEEVASDLYMLAAQLGNLNAKAVIDQRKGDWRRRALSAPLGGSRQDDAADRARRKLRDFMEQQSGRPR